MFDRIRAWSERNMPTRESFENVRWLRPLAHRILLPELWRFHRRSVPRGVALGVIVGVLVPIAQFLFAALFALPVRANVPVAAVTTIITNPFTTPLIWVAAYWVGSWLLRIDASMPVKPLSSTVVDDGGWEDKLMSWARWALSDAAPPTVLGLVVISVIGAVIGYVIATFMWRQWIAHKWRHRHDPKHKRRFGRG